MAYLARTSTFPFPSFIPPQMSAEYIVVSGRDSQLFDYDKILRDIQISSKVKCLERLHLDLPLDGTIIDSTAAIIKCWHK